MSVNRRWWSRRRRRGLLGRGGQDNRKYADFHLQISLHIPQMSSVSSRSRVGSKQAARTGRDGGERGGNSPLQGKSRERRFAATGECTQHLSHMPFATSHTTTDPIQYQHIHIALCLWTLYTSTDITASPRARTDAATHRLPAFSGLVPACIPPPRHDLSTTYHTRPCRILHIRSYSTFLLRHLFALSWPFDAVLASPAEPSVRLRLARREDTSARERIRHNHWNVNAYTNPPRLETPWQ